MTYSVFLLRCDLAPTNMRGECLITRQYRTLYPSIRESEKTRYPKNFAIPTNDSAFAGMFGRSWYVTRYVKVGHGMFLKRLQGQCKLSFPALTLALFNIISLGWILGVVGYIIISLHSEC